MLTLLIILKQKWHVWKEGDKFDIYVVNKSIKSKWQIPQGVFSLQKREEKKSSPDSQSRHARRKTQKWGTWLYQYVKHITLMQSGKKSIIYVDATTVSFCISILKDIRQVMPEFDKNFHLWKILGTVINLQASTYRSTSNNLLNFMTIMS